LSGGHIFGVSVADPRPYGLLKLDDSGRPNGITEKPEEAERGYAIPGMYFYSDDVWARLDELTPSARGELEISDLNAALLASGELAVEILPRGSVWIDAGTVPNLRSANEYVSVYQERTGLLVGSPEEAAWRQGWINNSELVSAADRWASSSYGLSLLELV